MSLPALDNLVRIGQLKAELRNETEARRMLAGFWIVHQFDYKDECVGYIRPLGLVYETETTTRPESACQDDCGYIDWATN